MVLIVIGVRLVDVSPNAVLAPADGDAVADGEGTSSSARVVNSVDVRHLCSIPMLRLKREGAKYSPPCSERGARRGGEGGW